jgi:hypothetical protein
VDTSLPLPTASQIVDVGQDADSRGSRAEAGGWAEDGVPIRMMKRSINRVWVIFAGSGPFRVSEFAGNGVVVALGLCGSSFP